MPTTLQAVAAFVRKQTLVASIMSAVAAGATGDTIAQHFEQASLKKEIRLRVPPELTGDGGGDAGPTGDAGSGGGLAAVAQEQTQFDWRRWAGVTAFTVFRWGRGTLHLNMGARTLALTRPCATVAPYSHHDLCASRVFVWVVLAVDNPRHVFHVVVPSEHCLACIRLSTRGTAVH